VREIAVLEYRRRLIVTLQFDLTDSAALLLQETILRRIEEAEARGLIIDISALGMVDSFIARVLMETSLMAGLMNVRTVLVGMKPEVALTLVQMGFKISGIVTAVDLERGLEKLDELEALDSGKDAE
jgi:rsbT antagonist protein RsbS